jgi:predicted small lipoprotein YifL
MYQALQLLAYFYPEFDHFWQLEMDIKFLGNTRHYLDAVSNFAKTEPRKQARERASFFLMSAVHGAYSELLSAVNESLAGGGLWGPLRIPDIEPIGPSPPTKTPEEDDFSWGVGEEADLIVTNACFDVRKSGDWVYKDWIRGFTQGERTPRVSCPPAITRSSSTLLRAVHAAQTEQGLCVPSEATLPSFALWHGLKMSYPPQPWWQNPRRETAEMFRFFNGGWPSRENDGMAYGEAMYNAKWHYDITNSATWWWASEFPGQVFEAWYDGNGGNEGRGGEKGGAGKKEAELPYILRKQRGKTWAPNVAIHPVKLDR